MAVGWWAASVVATVTGDHARRSQGSQQTAAKSLCSAVPADSGWKQPRQWHRPQEQVSTHDMFITRYNELKCFYLTTRKSSDQSVDQPCFYVVGISVK